MDLASFCRESERLVQRALTVMPLTANDLAASLQVRRRDLDRWMLIPASMPLLVRAGIAAILTGRGRTMVHRKLGARLLAQVTSDRLCAARAFVEEHQHLPDDEIARQWAAVA